MILCYDISDDPAWPQDACGLMRARLTNQYSAVNCRVCLATIDTMLV